MPDRLTNIAPCSYWCREAIAENPLENCLRSSRIHSILQEFTFLLLPSRPVPSFTIPISPRHCGFLCQGLYLSRYASPLPASLKPSRSPPSCSFSLHDTSPFRPVSPRAQLPALAHATTTAIHFSHEPDYIPAPNQAPPGTCACA